MGLYREMDDNVEATFEQEVSKEVFYMDLHLRSEHLVDKPSLDTLFINAINCFLILRCDEL